ncbi:MULTISPECIES: prolyl aminopeptidase [Streptomycetaceae]|uniref:Proline iminopeptidase n=1 Tax=Streptantibioticus cattleyicolor (strain ATCC 35852 / DSM 46488 / JCM 4925 / NBRC 14057 / NRRL 8057) TaxID=1003195 RepID=F8JSV1_STREN|nr:MULTISPECIES: prolyl aminopeptidase [Streptomycetaceae]AEW98012.1 aminopeptidase [Streptantibioticus cattleyicolor NRRL 8057 = DSM 46488]MYS62411.1 prolyl aminopeptidase [Streptomyces sp. SID5468]CCB78331.1 putative proline iminopeptidase [Streptantibioticus cattleyicolor NRRL 8057 = DSM 46488]
MGLHPEIEPYEHGMLDTGDGHHVYWEVCGNPAGRPAVVLHGGPGSGCTPAHRRYFDPAVYRIVLMDQRGCGRSTPHAGETTAALRDNTADHLMGDLEALRRLLGIERWLVWGVSWGSALALRYAQRFPERVTELLLTALATGRQAEVDLLVRGAGAFFPRAWAAFRDGVPPAERDGDLAAAYARLLADPDPDVREKAARDWCAWESAMVPAQPQPLPRYLDPRFRLGFARLVTHYWANGHWFGEDGIVLSRAADLAGIPGTVVQGGLDLGNLLGTPWLLTAAWPGSELRLVDDAGHDSGASGVTDLLVAAADRYAARG